MLPRLLPRAAHLTRQASKQTSAALEMDRKYATEYDLTVLGGGELRKRPFALTAPPLARRQTCLSLCPFF